MRNWQERAATVPLRVFFPVSVILIGAFSLLMNRTLQPVWVVASLANGVIATAVATVYLSRSRHRDRMVTGTGRRVDQMVFARALRTGEPPSDTSLDEPLLALVARRRTQLRRARFMPWIFVVIATIPGLFAIGDPDVVWFLNMAAAAAVAVIVRASYVRGSVRLPRLEPTLRERARHRTSP